MSRRQHTMLQAQRQQLGDVMAVLAGRRHRQRDATAVDDHVAGRAGPGPVDRAGSCLRPLLERPYADTSRTTEPQLTALGHSCGSTTTGYALQHTQTKIDDAVVFGSPGLGTDTLNDLHVPAGRTAVIETRWDPVADLGSFGRDPNHLDDAVDLSSRDAIGAESLPRWLWPPVGIHERAPLRASSPCSLSDVDHRRR